MFERESGSEEENETAAEKRLRLAEQFLSELQGAGERGREGGEGEEGRDGEREMGRASFKGGEGGRPPPPLTKSCPPLDKISPPLTNLTPLKLQQYR